MDIFDILKSIDVSAKLINNT